MALFAQQDDMPLTIREVAEALDLEYRQVAAPLMLLTIEGALEKQRPGLYQLPTRVCPHCRRPWPAEVRR